MSVCPPEVRVEPEFPPESLRVLFLAISPDQVARELDTLRAAGLTIEPQVVSSREELETRAAAGESWDVVLADSDLPRRTGLRGFEILARAGSSVPVLLVSGDSDDGGTSRLAQLPSAVRQAVEGQRRKAAQASEQRSEASERKFFATAALGIGRVNLATDAFVEANLALAQTLGYERESDLRSLTVAASLSAEGRSLEAWLDSLGRGPRCRFCWLAAIRRSAGPAGWRSFRARCGRLWKGNGGQPRRRRSSGRKPANASSSPPPP